MMSDLRSFRNLTAEVLDTQAKRGMLAEVHVSLSLRNARSRVEIYLVYVEVTGVGSEWAAASAPIFVGAGIRASSPHIEKTRAL
jgi:hypothetical protein